jgi:hypothetical protein
MRGGIGHYSNEGKDRSTVMGEGYVNSNEGRDRSTVMRGWIGQQ